MTPLLPPESTTLPPSYDSLPPVPFSSRARPSPSTLSIPPASAPLPPFFPTTVAPILPYHDGVRTRHHLLAEAPIDGQDSSFLRRPYPGGLDGDVFSRPICAGGGWIHGRGG